MNSEQILYIIFYIILFNFIFFIIYYLFYLYVYKLIKYVYPERIEGFENEIKKAMN